MAWFGFDWAIFGTTRQCIWFSIFGSKYPSTDHGTSAGAQTLKTHAPPLSRWAEKHFLFRNSLTYFEIQNCVVFDIFAFRSKLWIISYFFYVISAMKICCFLGVSTRNNDNFSGKKRQKSRKRFLLCGRVSYQKTSPGLQWGKYAHRFQWSRWVNFCPAWVPS